jgi:hypothetical protein
MCWSIYFRYGSWFLEDKQGSQQGKKIFPTSIPTLKTV